jgi:hypothetical protein
MPSSIAVLREENDPYRDQVADLQLRPEAAEKREEKTLFCFVEISPLEVALSK